MTFSFVMDAFPDYTKFNQTEKVLADIQVITEDVDTSDIRREACVPTAIEAVDPDVDVTYANEGIEKNIKVTAQGTNVAGKGFYDTEVFGTLAGNATQVTINFREDLLQTGEKYTIVQQNPALDLFYSADANVANGVKTKEYKGEDLAEGYGIILSDKAGMIKVELKDANGESLQVINVVNKVEFKKVCKVIITDNGITITKITVDGEVVDQADLTEVDSGAEIVITAPTASDVTATGIMNRVEKTGNDYRMTTNSTGKDVRITIKA